MLLLALCVQPGKSPPLGQEGLLRDQARLERLPLSVTQRDLSTDDLRARQAKPDRRKRHRHEIRSGEDGQGQRFPQQLPDRGVQTLSILP